MSDARLEWSSPAGSADPGVLARLAGPWRRSERPDLHLELFRARLDAPDDDRPARDPTPILSTATTRLRSALRGESIAAPEAELLASLSALHIRLDANQVSASITDLWRRATGPARVETRRGEHIQLLTDLGVAGSIALHVAPDVSPDAIALHSHAVAAALRTRLVLMHTAREAFELTATIAALASSAAMWLALPLAWRYLHQLLAEPAASDGD